MVKFWRLLALMLLFAVTAAEVAEAQRFGRRGRGRGGSRYWTDGDDYTIYNVPYDGRFTFVRLSFTPGSGGGGWWGRGGDLQWDHDWPTAERNLMQIVRELSSIRPYMDGSQIFAADDPELHKYPVAYVSEPGFWTVNEAEAKGLRDYLLKGGFLIFDDFSGPYEFLNLQQCMAQVLPGARIVPLDASHPIFHSFFSLDTLEFRHPYDRYQTGEFLRSEFWGIHEDNDPEKRLMAIINYNNDIGELWEFSATGWFPIPLTNEAYKLGINYIVYAMTH